MLRATPLQHNEQYVPQQDGGKVTPRNGIQNIPKITCYMNTTLQLLYSIRELREKILLLKDSEIDTIQIEIKPGKINESATNNTRKFVKILQYIFKRLATPNFGAPDLRKIDSDTYTISATAVTTSILFFRRFLKV